MDFRGNLTISSTRSLPYVGCHEFGIRWTDFAKLVVQVGKPNAIFLAFHLTKTPQYGNLIVNQMPKFWHYNYVASVSIRACFQQCARAFSCARPYAYVACARLIQNCMRMEAEFEIRDTHVHAARSIKLAFFLHSIDNRLQVFVQTILRSPHAFFLYH